MDLFDQIHDDQIRLPGLDQVDGGVHIFGFTADLHIRLMIDHVLDSHPENGVIFNDENGNFFHGQAFPSKGCRAISRVTRVPPGDMGSKARVARMRAARQVDRLKPPGQGPAGVNRF
jgi:hypothetical protein